MMARANLNARGITKDVKDGKLTKLARVALLRELPVLHVLRDVADLDTGNAPKTETPL
jgi:hypothetical protein